MIKFKCPHCGKDVSAGDEHAGKKGRCPGCKELFVIPAAGAAKPAPAPAVERRTAPPAADEQDEAPPKKKKRADDDGDDLEVVEESKNRAGAKVGKRRADDDEDEAIAEAPRKKRPARDDDEDDRPRKKRGRDDDEDEDEPRARKKRGRDEDEDEREDEDEPRARKKRKKRRGEYADCPNCGCRGDATMVGFTWWGGIIGPRLFTHVRCNRCSTCYNGKTGEYNTTKIAIYVGVTTVIAIAIFVLVIMNETGH